MESREIKIMIGKTCHQFDTSEEARIHDDLDSEMDTVAARIGFFGELLAAVNEEAIRLDTAYRSWRAAETMRLLKDDPKVSEWKVRAAIEASDKFRQFKDAKAKIKYNLVALDSLIQALAEKSPNLRSKGARLRAELEGLDMTTRAARADRSKEELRRLYSDSEERKGK